MKTGMRKQRLHRMIKSVGYWSATDQLSFHICSEQGEIKSKRERSRWISL